MSLAFLKSPLGAFRQSALRARNRISTVDIPGVCTMQQILAGGRWIMMTPFDLSGDTSPACKVYRRMVQQKNWSSGETVTTTQVCGIDCVHDNVLPGYPGYDNTFVSDVTGTPPAGGFDQTLIAGFTGDGVHTTATHREGHYSDPGIGRPWMQSISQDLSLGFDLSQQITLLRPFVAGPVAYRTLFSGKGGTIVLNACGNRRPVFDSLYSLTSNPCGSSQFNNFFNGHNPRNLGAATITRVQLGSEGGGTGSFYDLSVTGIRFATRSRIQTFDYLSVCHGPLGPATNFRDIPASGGLRWEYIDPPPALGVRQLWFGGPAFT